MPITNIGLPTSFVPTSITGCSLWMDGADPAGTGIKPATGSALTTWVDKSSNTSSTPTFSGTATYNDGVVFSSSSVGGTFISAPANAIYTSFSVITATTPTNGVFSLRNPGNNDEIRVFCIIGNTNAFQIANAPGGSWATILYNSTTFPLTNTLTTSSNTTTSIGLAINGNTTSSNVSGTAYTLSTCSNWSIGWNTATVSEVILYNSILNMDQRQQVERYLAWKWKVPSVLPTSHLGYKGPPVAFGRIPYYTAFSPLSIPTCTLWLDAADSSTVTGTTTVTAWADKSGNSRPVTITSAPSYGTTTQNNLRTLAFNNNQVTTSIVSAVGTGDFTLIAVWYQSTGGTNTVLSLGTSGSSSQSLGYSATKYNFYQFGSAQESAYTTSAGSWVIQVGTRISSVKTVYINGIAGTTPSIDSFNQTVTTVTIGRGDSFGITGQIGEILIYTGTMEQTDQQKIESYLAQKWGLTAQLPLIHLNTRRPAGLPAGVPQVLLLFTALSSFMSTYYNLSGAYALANIANGISANSATPAYVWTVAVPPNAKGKNGILALFFNLYSSAFTVGQSFDYGVYLDGVSQLLSDTGTIRYVQSSASTYALSSNGVSMGTNGLVQLLIPMSFAPSASQIQIGLKNSTAGMTPTNSALPGYTSNIVTSSGTLNTSGYNPQTLFTTGGSNFYTVPTNTSAGVPTGVYIYLWGSGGQYTHYPGGGGGFVSGYYSCPPGTNLIYVVGNVTSTATSNGGGGAAPNQQGGGFSGVFLSNAGGIVQSNAIAIAGGGGAGVLFPSGTVSAGWGGYPNGGAMQLNTSGVFSFSSSITGGTQTAGGLGATALNNGAALMGGPCTDGQGRSGGGGGGWFGGGGNAGGGNGQPGAGGSGYIGNVNGATGGVGLTANAAYENGVNTTIAEFTQYQGSSAIRYPGGTSSPYYPSPFGQGNTASSGTGAVVIIPAIGTSATQIGVKASLFSG